MTANVGVRFALPLPSPDVLDAVAVLVGGQDAYVAWSAAPATPTKFTDQVAAAGCYRYSTGPTGARPQMAG